MIELRVIIQKITKISQFSLFSYIFDKCFQISILNQLNIYFPILIFMYRIISFLSLILI